MRWHGAAAAQTSWGLALAKVSMAEPPEVQQLLNMASGGHCGKSPANSLVAGLQLLA